MVLGSYLVIGCGHFGSQAVTKLFKKEALRKIIVVDKNRKSFEKFSSLSIETIVGDGLTYLNQSLLDLEQNHFIIPAVPFHLAFEIILSRLKEKGAKRQKVPSLPGVPNPVKDKNGSLYTSMADFLCPGDCPEPALYCRVTGQKRSKPLYRLLRDLKGPFESKVIRSEQLEPGVGGFRLERLLNLTKELKKQKDKKRLILISTACRCHAVTSALSF